MRDTETDAAARLMCNVSSDFARKLKYERDAAMALSEERYGYWQDAIQEYEDMRSKWRQVTKERDEAREAFVIATDQMVIAHGKLREANKERDEARKQIKELIYIAERAIDLAEIDYENDKFGVVSELRAGVEEIKRGRK
jgi:hypothetical protein